MALQWSLRFIGLVSVFILARLLIAGGFRDHRPRDGDAWRWSRSARAVGLRQALLRIKAPDREHLDTAWTIQLMLFGALGLLLVALGAARRAFLRPAGAGAR